MRHEVTRGLLAATFAWLMVAAGPLTATAGDHAGQKSTGDASEVTLVSQWAKGQCSAVAADASWLWAGNGAVIQLFDVSNPADPLLRREYVMPSWVTTLEIWSHYLAVGTQSDGLQVLDIADPLTATDVVTMGTGSVANVFCYGSRFYLACGLDGLQVYDHNSFLAPPTLAATYDPAGGVCLDVQLIGGYLLLASGAAGVTVLDIDALEGPAVTTVDVPGARSIDPWGTVAWVAAATSGLYALDITAPEAPVVLDSVATGGNCDAVKATADAVYVADGYAGLTVYDPATPDDFALRGAFDTTGFTDAVVAVGDVLYAADGPGGVCVFNVTNPADPALTTSEPAFDDANGVASDGDGTLYVACNTRGIVSLDISDPHAPAYLGNLDPVLGTFNDLQLVGDLLYAAAGWPGLAIIDVTDPTAMTEVGSADVPNGVDVAVTGELAFVACLGDGVYRVHVLDPAAPVELNSYDSAGTAYGVKANGNLVFIADGTNGLVVVDFLGTGGVAEQIAHLDTPGTAYDVEYNHPWVYIADGSGGLRIVNYGADPDNPVEVGHLDLPVDPVSVEYGDDVAYLACASGGVYLVDVNVPESPFLLGWYDTGGSAQDVAYTQPYAWVADDADGVWGVIYNAYMPVHLSGLVAARMGLGAAIEWTVSAPDPASRFRVWRETRDGGRESVSGFIAADRLSYRFVDDAPPAGATRYWLEEQTANGSIWHGPVMLPANVRPVDLGPTARPNPFNPQTTVMFVAVRDEHTRLSVYDLCGRRVATLLDGVVAAGEHRVNWDGRTDAGRDAAAGTYLLRLETVERAESRKISLVR